MREILTANSVRKLEMIEQGGQTIISESTDVSAALERNKRLRNAGMTKTGMGDHYAASIPVALLNEWAQKRGLPGWQAVAQDDRLLDQFLQDPAYSDCRIYQGRV